MKKEMKLKVARLFRRAQGHIRFQQDRFVCLALVSAYRRYCYPTSVLTAAEKVINDRLDGHFTVQSWLEAKHPHLKRRLTAKNMRRYRIAWLDSLIQEFDPNRRTM